MRISPLSGNLYKEREGGRDKHRETKMEGNLVESCCCMLFFMMSLLILNVLSVRLWKVCIFAYAEGVEVIATTGD